MTRKSDFSLSHTHTLRSENTLGLHCLWMKNLTHPTTTPFWQGTLLTPQFSPLLLSFHIQQKLKQKKRRKKNLLYFLLSPFFLFLSLSVFCYLTLAECWERLGFSHAPSHFLGFFCVVCGMPRRRLVRRKMRFIYLFYFKKK